MRSSYGKRLPLEIGHVEDLYAFDRIDYVLRIGCQFGNPFLEMEHLLGEFGRFQAGCAQQLNGIFQKHFVGVDRLWTSASR